MDLTSDKPKIGPTDKVLRIINVIAWIPGLVLLIVDGVITRRLWAFVGIAPLSLSMLFALAVLSGGPKRRALTICMDIVLAGFLLGIDIWGWAILGHDYWDENGGVSSLREDLGVCCEND